MLNNIIQVLPVAYFVAVAVPLIITDNREHRLPNKLTIPAVPITAFAWLSLAILDNRWADFWLSLGMAVIVFAVGLGVNRMGNLGMGDVKLFTGLALMLTWFIGAWSLLLPIGAVVICVAHHLIKVAIGKARAGSSVAMGQYIFITAGLMFGLGVM